LAGQATRVKQIRLTERQVQTFIAAHKDMAAAVGSTLRQPNRKVRAEFEIIAKKSGFNDFAEFATTRVLIQKTQQTIEQSQAHLAAAEAPNKWAERLGVS
jgi:hypothetical protein